jgi:hypothetical protein
MAADRLWGQRDLCLLDPPVASVVEQGGAMGIRRVASIVAALAFAVTAFAAAPAGAALSPNIIIGHGSFEQPPTPVMGVLYAPGTSFDGWNVSITSVSLGIGVPGIASATDGQQFLALVNPFQSSAPFVAGRVCRRTPAVAGHRYNISFDASSLYITSTFDVALGDARAAVTVPADTTFPPAEYSSLQTSITSPRDHAVLCLSAHEANPSSGWFALIDRVRVADLG